MRTEKDIFLRRRFEKELEIWDVAEVEVAAPKFTLKIEEFNDEKPADTKSEGFMYYPVGSELPESYVSYLKENNQLTQEADL